MKKIAKELKQKTAAELLKDKDALELEIAKLQLERKVNPPKDTNLIFKKRKRLAVVLTLLQTKN